MLPIVTDMFIQCRKVRSLAAHHMSLLDEEQPLDLLDPLKATQDMGDIRQSL